MATEEKKPDAESTKTQSTPSSSTNQSKVCPKKYPCKNTWNYLNTQQPDQNQGFEFFCKLRSLLCGCFCCRLVLRILWEEWMECSSALVLSVLLLVLGKFSLVKYFLSFWSWGIIQAVCLYPWRWLENWWISSCGVGNSYSGSLKPGDAQRRCYCLTMKPFQKVKVGF